MCNEREEGTWYIHAGKISDDMENLGTVTVASNDDAWTTMATVSDVYKKEDHDNGGVGLRRVFNPELVADVDRTYKAHWDLPEYLPFRECVKMGIQDGIEAGMKRASAKHDKVVADKNKKITELEAETKRWKDAFRGLLNKCQQGVEALDFISRVVHGSCGTKY